jgi:hypothetical protein
MPFQKQELTEVVRRSKGWLLAAIAGLLGACAGGSEEINTVAAAVNAGPLPEQAMANVLYTGVTICAPGSSTLCQTVNDVIVDTGSSGFRVLASALGPTVTPTQLRQLTDPATGNPIVECMQFADGYGWGPVKVADLRFNGETAAAVPIQVLGDPSYPATTIPTSCSSSGGGELDTLDELGANGILGIGNFLQDCGPGCESGMQDGSAYNQCPTGTACEPTTVSEDQQVVNPVSAFPVDNNGLLIQLPAVAAPGALSVTGALVFGVGTQSNNGLDRAAVYALNEAGTLSTLFNSATLSQSIIDSGSNGYFFADSALPPCSGEYSAFYCPLTTQNFTAAIPGQNGQTANVAFSVDNAIQDFNNGGSAMPNLGGTLPAMLGNDVFDWGLPFFYGKSVYVVFEQHTAAGYTGPFIAF